MIGVAEAYKLIMEHMVELPPIHCHVEDAVGLTLAADVYANTDVPSFDQAAMDGYAFNFHGWQLHKELLIQGKIQAGLGHLSLDSKHCAARIFTGAVVPHNADTVVMQEKTLLENDILTILDDNITQGANVRPIGSQIREGDLAMLKNTTLSPAAIGYLIGIGVTEIMVYPRPKISIIVTGNELQKPGIPLEKGMVYESNSYSLVAALKLVHLDAKCGHAIDDLHILKEKMSDAIDDSDVAIMVGGVSVGEFDFVPKAATLNGVHTIFHKIKQRPGKPMFFGMKHNKAIFGLPGNPSSVLSCFYLYVLPALAKISHLNCGPKKITVPIHHSYQKAAGLTHFLKGFYDGTCANVLSAQESYKLSSYAISNCLIEIDENETEVHKGSDVTIHLLNF